MRTGYDRPKNAYNDYVSPLVLGTRLAESEESEEYCGPQCGPKTANTLFQGCDEVGGKRSVPRKAAPAANLLARLKFHVTRGPLILPTCQVFMQGDTCCAQVPGFS